MSDLSLVIPPYNTFQFPLSFLYVSEIIKYVASGLSLGSNSSLTIAFLGTLSLKIRFSPVEFFYRT